MKTEVLQTLKFCISQIAFMNCVSAQSLISVICRNYPSIYY